MTYLPDLHTYLHQSSLLIQAYPTTRITTKYSLPRRPHGNPNSKRSQKAAATTNTSTATTAPTTATGSKEPREKRDPAATLTLKTFHPHSGICLKYRTDKAQEVGRLMNGLGRLAKGEIIEMPSTGAGAPATTTATQMEVDGEQPPPTEAAEGVLKDGKAAGSVAKSATEMTQQPSSGGGGGGGGGKKKKKGGKK